ncbi:4519_t:CDS:1, partial [Scutellospora calospora]
PNLRPDIQEVFKILQDIISESNAKPKLLDISQNMTNSQSKSEENLIQHEHFELITKWINQTSRKGITKFLPFKPKNNYDFKLLTRGSRDGFNPANFHDKCDNKGPILTILKIEDENNILDGYNSLNLESSKKKKCRKKNKSFIFNL